MVVCGPAMSTFQLASREVDFPRKQAKPPCWSPLHTATARRLQPPAFKTALLSFGLGPIGQRFWAGLVLGAVLWLLLRWGRPGFSALPFWGFP